MIGVELKKNYIFMNYSRIKNNKGRNWKTIINKLKNNNKRKGWKINITLKKEKQNKWCEPIF